MKVKAVAKRVGVSAIKARVIADTVRGMNAEDAVGILTYVSKGAALPVKKVIQSAIANAKNNHNISTNDLIVSEIRVDKGPIANFNAKRFETLGKGGYARFDRKYCHITVMLEEKSNAKLGDKNKSDKKVKDSTVVIEDQPKKDSVVKKSVKKANTKKKSAN